MLIHDSLNLELFEEEEEEEEEQQQQQQQQELFSSRSHSLVKIFNLYTWSPHHRSDIQWGLADKVQQRCLQKL